MSIGKTRKQMLLNEEEFFTTPDMGEYLDNNLIIEAANKVANFETGGEFLLLHLVIIVLKMLLSFQVNLLLLLMILK